MPITNDSASEEHVFASAKTCVSKDGPELRLRHQPVKQLRIYVAAGQHRDHDLALHVEPAGEQRREADGAARLDHQLQLAEREGDRAADFLGPLNVGEQQ
jgi:hypothetical protein